MLNEDGTCVTGIIEVKSGDESEVSKAQQLSRLRSPCPGTKACGWHYFLWMGSQKQGHKPQA